MNGQEFFIKLDELLEATKEACEQFAVSTEAALESERPQILAIDTDNTRRADPALQLDMAMLRAAPVAVVPPHSPFFPLAENGHRFLLAADGLYLEVRRPWLHLVHRLALQTAVAMPYGRIEPRTELAFGRLSNALPLIRNFAASARRELPNEWADMLVWNATDQALSDLNVGIETNSPGAVQYRCRELQDHESIAIDLHSHGTLSAFFSDTDNRDDAGAVKIAGVIGNLDTNTPTVAFRLCVLGLYLPIAVPAAAIFAED
jgi:PRTRC genetic system protein A